MRTRATSHHPCSGWRVVVASSSVERRQELARELRTRGCVVRTASDGMSLLRCLSRALDDERPTRRPDLIVADVELPGCSGISVLEGVRGLGWDVPFFLIANRHRDDVARRAFAAGATRVMSSAVEVEMLRTAVLTCLLVSKPRAAQRRLRLR